MKNMDDNEFGGKQFLFGGNQDDSNDHLLNSDSDTDEPSESSVFRTFMGGSGDGPKLFGSEDSHTESEAASDSPDSVPHLNYRPEDLEFDETYPLTLDKPIFKRLEPETDEASSSTQEEAKAEPAAAEPSYPEPDYTQPEIAEPVFEQPEIAEPVYVQPQAAEPFYPVQETAEPSYPEPDYTQPDEPAAYMEAPSEAQSFDTDASDYPTDDSYNPVPSPFADNAPNSPAQTDDFTEDDEMSDTAFPLFLSFKANDSASTVSEAIREKNAQKSTDNTPRAFSGKAAAAKTPVGDQNINKMLDESEPAVFKPYKALDADQNSYDIPSIDARKAPSNGKTSPEPVPSKPVFKQQEDRQARTATSETDSETSEGNSSDKTVRPGTRYYPAAQQMGYAAPMPQRELSTKRKKKKHTPLIISLTIATVLVAAFFIWSKSDIGTMLARNESQSSASAAASSAASDDTSSSSLIAVVSATPSPAEESSASTVKATATPTPKATATPTPKATATPTPKATATPTPSATPTPASGVSAKTPSGFSTAITDGKASGDTATFNIQFKNLSKTDVSLFDGVEYLSITFNTSGAPVTSVTSDSFTFTPDPKNANTFIGIPTDKEVIAKKDTKTVGITGVTDGKDVGKYSIKYYVKNY